MCEYCEDGYVLDITYLDVSAFSESIEAFIDGERIIVEKYDGDLKIKVKYCPMCGDRLGGAE
jgi:hypothetical protein